MLLFLFPFLLPVSVLALATPKDGTLFPPPPSNNEPFSPSLLVNTFIGTTNGGHSFPGATIPHGMVKVGADTDSPGNQAGYDADPQFSVTGFSQLHDQGTGGSPSLSNFKIFPLASCHTFSTCPTQLNDRKAKRVLVDGFPDDAAEPGYFSTNLTTSIRAELTSTRRVALHRYTFPPTNSTSSSPLDPTSFDNRPRLIIDIMNDGPRSAILPFVDILLPSNNNNNSSTKGGKGVRVTGGANFASSFGLGRYDVFVCVDFAKEGGGEVEVEEWGTYTGRFPILNAVNLKQLDGGSEQGALLTFSPTSANGSTILVRAGVSFISTSQACRNAEEEIPDFDFDRVREEARRMWDVEVLGMIEVDNDNVGEEGEEEKEMKELFYSSLYRTHIVPADYTGENPLWNSTEPYFDSLYCNWDTFRTLYPLYSLHSPLVFCSIIRGFINIQRHEGWLPECRGATTVQFIQGGSNGDPILGEFLVKYPDGLKGLVRPEDVFEAVFMDAEVQPENWNLRGRQVDIWKRVGYIPVDVFEPGGTNTKQVSRALEYALGDFAASQIAKIVGNETFASVWVNRSQNFINNWDADLAMPGNESIVGFFQPRFLNGTFNITDPRHCSVNDPEHGTCFLNPANRDGFYEDAPIVYSQFAQHDVASLIKLQGGPEKFLERLDFIFDNNYFDSSNEPSFQIPFMYHYADRPSSSIKRSRQIISEDFNNSVNGLPGNDDAGAMASYVVFHLLGLYPVPSTRQYLLSSPFFQTTTFHNQAFNSTTKFTAINFDGASGNPKNLFVKSVKVNGKKWESNCWIDFEVFERGGEVEVELTDDENVGCGGSLPGSLSTGGFR